MRGAIGRRIPNPNFSIFHSSFPFSTSSSSSGRGRGGGGGGGDPSFFSSPRVPGQLPPSDDPVSTDSDSAGSYGRGKPSSTPFLSSFSSVVAHQSPPSGLGGGENQQPTDSASQSSGPIFFRKKDESDPISASQEVHLGGEDNAFAPSIFSLLSSGGAGRGKTNAKLPGPPEQQLQEENRHLRPPRPAGPGRDGDPSASDTPKMSTVDAVKKALSILARSDADGVGSGAGGGREMSARGRGRGRGRGRFGGRGGRTGRRDRDEDKDEEVKLYVGDDADGEKLAKAIGPEKMSQLTDAFEEMSHGVLPSPEMDRYIDALDTNLAIECEPEYLFTESGRNPDIDEATPTSLREELEKMKPLLMAYEGIQSQEDWEKAINEVMDRVPLLKEIVDHYSGPDRVTAKRQNEELERIAETLPERAPASVQKFTSRALLSLQSSNSGWGFERKRQFMDKLAREVNQQYK